MPDTITDINGDPVNAVYGFTDFVAGLLQQASPNLIGFAFDESLDSSHRNEIYPEYKANREPAPEELKRQFSYCRDFVDALGILQISSNKYEADDLIGTLANRMRRLGHAITILSSDKDLAQLIHANDTLWDYAKNKEFNPIAIKKRFGVRPDQIADQLALAGDKVDNIPGIPGIGMATAAKLLNRFNSLEQLLVQKNAISKMKIRGAQRIQSLVSDHEHLAQMSKQLTIIKEDIRFNTPPKLHRRKIKKKKLLQLFAELEFSTARRGRWLRIIEEGSI